MNAWVYMLRCSDGSYYVGSARGSLENRIGQHQAGEVKGYTSSRRPVTLVWAGDFQFITDAIVFERQLKGWSRVKKEALIAGEYAKISEFSQRGFRPRSASSFETPRRPSPAPPPQDEALKRNPDIETLKRNPHPEERAARASRRARAKP